MAVDHKFIHSIYFTDPNGIALKASVRITNPTGKAPDYANTYIIPGPGTRPGPARRDGAGQFSRIQLADTSIQNKKAEL